MVPRVLRPGPRQAVQRIETSGRTIQLGRRIKLALADGCLVGCSGVQVGSYSCAQNTDNSCSTRLQLQSLCADQAAGVWADADEVSHVRERVERVRVSAGRCERRAGAVHR